MNNCYYMFDDNNFKLVLLHDVVPEVDVLQSIIDYTITGNLTLTLIDYNYSFTNRQLSTR